MAVRKARLPACLAAAHTDVQHLHEQGKGHGGIGVTPADVSLQSLRRQKDARQSTPGTIPTQ